MDTPGLSLFNPAGLDVLHEADVEDEEEDVEERRRIEEEVAKGLDGAFEGLDIDLEDDTSEMEDTGATNDGMQFVRDTPVRDGARFHRLVPEETQMHSTPFGEEKRYLRSESREEELKILYEARGKEINRLNTEINTLRDSKESELRLCKHELAILKGEKDNLMINVEQLQELLKGMNEENKMLIQEIESLKTNVGGEKRLNEEVKEELENSNHIIRNLQSQLQQLQKNDAVLKARQQHDAIIRSLKERHENEMYNLQQEVDRLYSQVRKQDNEVNDLKTKLIQKELVEPSQEFADRLKEKDLKLQNLKNKLQKQEKALEEMLGEKSRIITSLNARLDENQKRVSELISEKISIKKTEQDLVNATEALKSQRAENEELKVDLRAVEMKAQHFESLSKNTSIRELDSQIQSTLQKATNDVLARDREIASLKKRFSLLENLGEQGEDSLREKQKLKMELEKMSQKYINLKNKVRAYQEHCQKKERFYKEEQKNLEEDYRSTLLALSSKMECAYNTKEQQVELELMEMKDHFNSELAKLAVVGNVSSPLEEFKFIKTSENIHEDEFLACLSESSVSKKENARPKSRLEEIDKFFAKAQEDAKNKIANIHKFSKPFGTTHNS